MSGAVLIKQEEYPAYEAGLLPLSVISTKEDAATLLDCWEEAVNQGLLWVNVRNVHKTANGFFCFVVDPQYNQGTDILTTLRSCLNIPGVAPDNLNSVTARGLLGYGRGVPQSIELSEVQEEDIQTGFLSEESSYYGDFSLRLRREDTGEMFQVDHTSVLGRSKDCDVVIVDSARNISRRHCRIYIEDGKYFIEDLNSANGTFVSGSRIRPNNRIELRSSDSLSLADVPFAIL